MCMCVPARKYLPFHPVILFSLIPPPLPPQTCLQQSSYVNLKPTGLIPATMDHLRGLGSAGGHQDGRRALQVVPADEPNVSCDAVCATKVLIFCLSL